MKSFKKYLKEMSVEDALRVLGMSRMDLGDESKLKSAFRTASLKNHPDRGGTKEAQQDVNDAYASLKKVKGDEREEREERVRRENETRVMVRNILISSFKPENFVSYFSKLSGEKIFFNVEVYPKEKYIVMHDDAGFKAEFYNSDRSIVFNVNVWVYNISNIIKATTLGHGSISFPLYITTFGYANKQRHKFGVREWKSTSDHSFLSKPEVIFPKDKMDKIFSGRVKKKYKKSDFTTFLTSQLEAELPHTERHGYKIPINENLYIMFLRTPFGKIATWSFHYIEEKRRMNWDRVANLPVFSLLESEETAKNVYKFIMELRKKKGLENIVRYATAWINSEKAKKGGY